MFTFKVFFTFGGEERDYTSRVPFSLKWADLLDETLDEGTINVLQSKYEMFPAMMRVHIRRYRNDVLSREVSYLMAGDSAQERPVGSGKYNHILYLIEETKYLEGFIVDSITFNNSLGRSYTNNPYISDYVSEAKLVGGGGGSSTPRPPKGNYYTPIGKGMSLHITSVYDLFNNPAGEYEITGSIVVSIDGQNVLTIDNANTDENLLIEKVGSLEITYSILFDYGDYDVSQKTTYFLVAVENQSPLPKWTIKTVIDRVLTVAEPLRVGMSPRFTLNAAQAAEFDKIESPEFGFTKATLKEILDTIGGFIHGIPRLIGNVIHYDMLGGTERWEYADHPYVTNLSTLNGEDYASAIDSSADNLVNILNYAEGVVVEPYSNGYKTVRNEQLYARITDENMMIETQRPIQEPVQLLASVPLLGIYDVDLTPYLFERTSYVRLSSYDDKYPTSKAYALYYTQGGKGIYGLNFKPDRAWFPSWQKYSIVRIIEAASGKKIDPGDFQQSYDDAASGGAKGTINYFYPQLSFRFSYIPVFSARVKQTKSLILDLTKPRTRAYNQSENLIESRYYGENLNGVIERLGNIERTYTYIFNDEKKIPRAGVLFDDDYYISAVSVEYMPYHIKCTIGLSKDFNRLSQYVGINATKRQSEISETQAYKRDTIWSDYVVIGDAFEPDGNDLCTTEAMSPLANTFWQDSSRGISPITVTYAQGQSEAGSNMTKVALSTIGTAFGRAMVFSFNYEDNYSAGNESIKITQGDVTGYFSNGVQVTDYYGRIHYLNLSMCSTGADTSNVATSLALPRQEYPGGILEPFSTVNRPIILHKNSTEVNSISYQLEYVRNRKGIVIGSALARNCPLISGTSPNKHARLYVLPTRINKFANVVDVSAGALVISAFGISDITTSGKKIRFAQIPFNASGKSWVIVSGDTNELLIGENVDVVPGDTLNLTLTITHDIFKEV